MPDGRLVKGERRRRLLLDATLRLVGRGGLTAVTQRAVAAEAGVAASAVLYYFPTVDDLLVAALVDVNDRWVAALRELPADLDALVALVAGSSAGDAGLAEYELYLLAARRPQLRPELDRWWEALDALAARFAPERAAAFSAVLDGLFLRACTGADPERIREALVPLTS
ncbi:TetR family transcriptional regulator [Pseudonocardia petroleophila]|uniref:TetR family transcriptional regulator n=1 Tax=Pseudonocardia petroleophila TaxID=37331 RepID=A0A7G7MHY6_9PSEU|nr:TetR family transcriptional regulator [Pseudonocardia petroleophila]QNG52397.1 TetR family transcriptional regulator [Pseudonocardia petroleophila]